MNRTFVKKNTGTEFILGVGGWYLQHLPKNWKYFNRLNLDYLGSVILTYISMAKLHYNLLKPLLSKREKDKKYIAVVVVVVVVVVEFRTFFFR